MEKRLSITLDVKKKLYDTLVGIKQFDNKAVIYIKFIQDSLTLNLTGLTIRANIKRPDGKLYFQDSTTGFEILNSLTGETRITLNSEALNVLGIANADISIFDSSNNKITSSTFQFMIEESMYSDQALQNGNSFDLLKNTIDTVNTAETSRSSAESARASAETTRIALDSTRSTNESTRIANETARQAAETARASAESTRSTNESARQTAESARASAETARQTAETARVSAYNTATNAYNAAIASQSNVEVTDARVDTNTGITSPSLKARLNSYTPSVIRENIPSGFTKLSDIDYTYMSTNPNSIKTLTESIAFVNGYKVVIPAGTVITLSAPPTSASREDLVFLEVWLDATTGAVQNRIRVVDGVDFNTYPEGVGVDENTWNKVAWASYTGGVTPQGANATPITITAGDNSSFLYVKMVGLVNGADASVNRGFSNPFIDRGLYVAGYGTQLSKTTLKTLDGYSYAIPMFRVSRRPSTGVLQGGEYNKVSPLVTPIHTQRIVDGPKVAHTGDNTVQVQVNGNTLVNLLGSDGNCEKTTDFVGANLDSSIKLFGLNSFKLTGAATSPSVLKDINGLDPTHKYLYSANLYVSSYTSGSISLAHCDYATWGGVTNNVNADTTKINQWQRKSMIITGQSTRRLYICGNTLTGIFNVDGIMLYDLTAMGIDSITDIPTLERMLPFVDGVQSSKPVAIKSKGKNLFDISNMNIRQGYYINDNNVETQLASACYDKTYRPVKPNTSYVWSGDKINGGSISGKVYYFDINKNFISRSSDFNTTTSVFTTPANCAYIMTQFSTTVLNLSNKFSDWQIEEGSTPTTAASHKSSQLLLPSVFSDLKKIGTVRDSVDLVRKKLVKRISDWINLDGSIGWNLYSVNYNGYKQFIFPQSSLGNTIPSSTSQLAIKNNGLPLTPGASYNAADQSYFGGSNVNITVASTDTGFSDPYVPTSAEMKAYFNGWKMCHDDGASPYLPSMVPYTPATWAEWNKTGSVGDSTGLEITADGVSNPNGIMNTNLKPSTRYGLLYNVVSNNLTLNFNSGTTGRAINFGVIPKTVGNQKVVATSNASITNNTVSIYVDNTEPAGNKIKIKDVRIFELPAGSQIETDFNTLTADQLVAKYPFYGLCTKNWKKVTDGTGQTAILPTGSYNGYTPYKMCYQLATPIETDISDSLKGRLYVNGGGETQTFEVEQVSTKVVTPTAAPNLVTNGDFSNGTTGWVISNFSSRTTSAVTNGVLIFTGAIAGDTAYQCKQTIANAINTGDKIYVRATVNLAKHLSKLTGSYSGCGININGTIVPCDDNFIIQTNGSTVVRSNILTATATYTSFDLCLGGDAPDLAVNDQQQISNIITVNLTKLFGAGNEPSQAWCDQYLSFGTNYIAKAPAGTTALGALRNNKDTFLGVQGNMVAIPANKYQNGSYEVFYRDPAETHLSPDINIIVGSKTLDIKDGATVGSVAVADTDVGFKKVADGAVTCRNKNYITWTDVTIYPISTPQQITLASTAQYNSVQVGDYWVWCDGNKLTPDQSKRFKVLSLDGNNKITIQYFGALGMATYNWFVLASDRRDYMYSDIVDTRDISDLRHQVSLTGFNYQSLLEESFDKLLRGEL